MKKKEFKKQLLAGVRKEMVLDQWEKDGLLRVDPEGVRVIIHYLIWHIWSDIGLVKLNSALFLHLNLRRVSAELPKLTDEYMTVYVDYTDEPNEYGKLGLVPMVQFNSALGFLET